MTKLSKYIIGIAATAAILFLVWYFSNIVTYILISAVLAIIGKPMVMLLSRLEIRHRHIPKWIAALLTLTLIWAILIAFFSLFIPLVLGKLNEFSSLDIHQIVDSFREPLASLQNQIEQLFGEQAQNFSLTDSLTRQIAPYFNIDVINRILASIVSIIGDTVVALFSISFITFFFLKEDHLFFDMVVAVFPKKYEENITRARNSITVLLIRYFTGIVSESIIMMLAISCILMLFGLPAGTAFFIGLIMGILNVVPYIGPLIGGGFSLLIGLISPVPGISHTSMLFIIGSTILVCKGFDDFVLQPTLYSNRVKAHPLEIFIVILIAGSVAGVLGMLLAIPAYNVIRVFAKEFFYNFRLVQKLTEKI